MSIFDNIPRIGERRQAIPIGAGYGKGYGSGFAFNPSTGQPAIPKTLFTLASTTGQVPSDVGSIVNNFTSRRADFSSPEGDITDLTCVDYAIQLITGPNLVANVGQHTIKRYCEYPAGVFHQVTWAEAPTKQMGGAAGANHQSDVIISSLTGEPLVIPANTKFWWRTVNVTGSTVSNFPVIVRPASSVALGIDDGNATTDLGNSGTINPSGSTNTFGPAAVVGTVMAANARGFVITGDSLAFGQGDVSSVSANYGSGWISRGLAQNYPCVKIAKGGQYAQILALGSVSFQAFLTMLGDAYTDVIIEAGLNDLSQNSRTAAQIMADRATFTALFSEGSRKWQTTLTARSDSTDSYATLGNQTPKSDGNMADLNPINALIRAATDWEVIDAADLDMDERDSGIHDGPFPPVSDGTHFLTPKAIDMASGLLDIVDAI